MIFRFIEKVPEIFQKEARFWPLHLFCLCLGAGLFGVGYAALPVLVLFGWMLVKIRDCAGMVTGIFRDDSNLFIWLFFAVFLLFVIISDVVNGGKWTHLEGVLYNLAIGIFLVTGALVATRHPQKKVIATYAGWIACWTVLLLLLLEVWFAGIYRYHHGVFVNPNILFSAVTLAGVANFAFFMELPLRRPAVKWVFLACAVWAASAVIRYSNSEALLPVLIAVSVILAIFSDNSKSMMVFGVVLFFTAFYCSFSDGMLKSLESVDLVSGDFWRRLLNRRETVWTVTARMISQYPLLGVGSGNFPEISSEILGAAPDIKLGLQSYYMHSHSIWTHHMAVHGLIAGTAFAGFLLSALRRVFYSYRKEKVLAFPLAVLGLFLVYFLYGLVELAPLFEELIPLVWGSLGLLMGMGYTDAPLYEGKGPNLVDSNE
ncbi:MAG: O-antigen ligase family protein [Thermovirgaceae bacterium]